MISSNGGEWVLGRSIDEHLDPVAGQELNMLLHLLFY